MNSIARPRVSNYPQRDITFAIPKLQESRRHNYTAAVVVVVVASYNNIAHAI